MTSRIITKDQDRRAVLQKLSAAGEDLALFCEDFEATTPRAKRVRAGVATLSAPFNFDELERCWYCGNWNLIAPAKTDFEPLDTFRQSDAQIAHVMQLHGLVVLVDSFHDNIEWKVHEVP